MAKQWKVDFKEVKSRVPIVEVVRRYGFLEKLAEKKPGKWVGSCPIHGGSNETSFHLDEKKNMTKFQLNHLL